MEMKKVYWELLLVFFICGIFNIGMFFFSFNNGWGLQFSLLLSGIESGLLGLLIAHSVSLIYKKCEKFKRKSKG